MDTPSENYRINTAKKMLRSTEDSVEEISHLVGFDSSSNFINTFKKLEDLTPLKYHRIWG